MKSLISLPDISLWNTSEVNNMSCMFYNCESLKVIPDIYKWNINSVTNLINMFSDCNLNLNVTTKFKNYI